jgi:hypothetical protein
VANAVLKTPELLEMILVHLDMREIFSFQRVCHHWQDIIMHDSLLLRRKLFLAPAFTDSPNYPTDNPFLKQRFPKFSTYLLQGNVKWRPKWVKALDESDLLRLGEEFFECETASWRRMLLTQPPIKEVVVYVSPGVEAPGEKKVARGIEELINAQVHVKDGKGVTMGMILEASAQAKKRSVGVKRNDSGYASLDILIDEREVEA